MLVADLVCMCNVLQTLMGRCATIGEPWTTAQTPAHASLVSPEVSVKNVSPITHDIRVSMLISCHVYNFLSSIFYSQQKVL